MASEPDDTHRLVYILFKKWYFVANKILVGLAGSSDVMSHFCLVLAQLILAGVVTHLLIKGLCTALYWYLITFKLDLFKAQGQTKVRPF